MLNEANNDSKFVTRKWNIVSYNSKAKYSVRNEITHNTKVLKSDLSDYNYAYILVIGDITVRAVGATQAAFKNCAPFTKCTTKIDETTIDDAEDLRLVMPMYNLIEYIQIILKQQEVYNFIQKMKEINLIQTLKRLMI